VESKAGSAQFPLLVPTEEDDPTAVHQREVVADALSRWDKPVLLAFSDQDPVFPFPKAGQRFVDLIPSATDQVRIEGAAHFLQEDRGEEIAGEIVRFLA
jgi:haloalkane dehalogenase